MAKQYITRIGVFSLGMVSAAASAIFGLIVGAFTTLAALGGGGGLFGMFFGVFFGIGAIIALPILYGIFGFCSGVVTALIYNTAIGFVGGLEVEIQ
ncbi:hypothetical protein [uncultured Methanolobus sp.]|uniref:hypothetical protein n=1 Tax=uncultured Methanolobus sp. TaxID=218300 RepID=UPI002AAAA12B|nr:hypothetical protein [uncultured Methanolobus sp.]